MQWLHQLPRHWQTTSVITYLLWPIELLYKLAWFIRRSLFALGFIQTHQLDATVIVVGNVVAGGGGKTPLTMAIVQRLTQQGHQVGVVSRGYGRTQHQVQLVNAQSTADQVGDEPLLIFQKCQVPVAVGANRVATAQQLLHQHPNIRFIVCDDGLQHAALQRDIEICVMDSMGIGNGHLLPAGPLRESWPRTVDLLLHTQRRTLSEGFESTRQLSAQAINGLGQSIELTALQNQSVEVVCGIAKPKAFAHMLEERGIQIAQFHALPDHANFSNWHASHPHLKLLCTEKDAIKLWATHPEAFAVPLLFEPEMSFWQAFDALVNTRHRYH
ncbi:MAG: tetraacyldisaccharide 4'-kinase [Pseudomonadota bacterium]|nr:tetraacyldisaccharide 4'-kinase [Pseudomonadota bacterium]